MSTEAAGSPAPQTPAPTGSEPQAPAPQPTAPSLTDGYTGIPEKFSSDPDFQGFNSLDDVLGEFKQLKGLHANREANGLAEIPGEGSTPEQQQAFWEKLGKPKSAAEYGFKAPEDLPQGLDYSDERAAWFAETAHKHNLTKAQADGVFADFHERIKGEFAQGMEAQQAANDALLENNFKTLEKEWGAEFGTPAFEAKHKAALKAFNFVATPEMASKFKENPELSSNPLVLDLLSKLGQKMEPDSAPAQSLIASSNGFQDTVEAVEQKIAKFHADGKFKKMLEGGKEGETFKSEWNQLNAKRRELLQP